MDQGDIEREAERAIEAAGLDVRKPPRMRALAVGLLGEGQVRVVHALSLPGDGARARVNGRWMIFLRSRLDPIRGRFALAHELAEVLLDSYREPDQEDVADRLAAALVLPASAYLMAARHVGDDWGALAEAAQASVAHVALRHSEVTGQPMALVARRIRMRGAEWGWPPERELRRIARVGSPLVVSRNLGSHVAILPSSDDG